MVALDILPMRVEMCNFSFRISGIREAGFVVCFAMA